MNTRWHFVGQFGGCHHYRLDPQNMALETGLVASWAGERDCRVVDCVVLVSILYVLY